MSTNAAAWLLAAVVAAAGAVPADASTSVVGPKAPAAPGLSQAQAVELVKTAVVQRADAPIGFVPENVTVAARKREFTQRLADDDAFYKCLHFPRPTWLARTQGPKLQAGPGRQDVEIVSTAQVPNNAAAAIGAMKAGRGAKAAACYRKRLLNVLHRSHVTGADVVVTQVAFPVTGADESYAYKSTLTFKNKPGYAVEGLLISSRVGQVLTTVGFVAGNGQYLDGSKMQSTAAAPVARVRKALTPQAKSIQGNTAAKKPKAPHSRHPKGQ